MSLMTHPRRLSIYLSPQFSSRSESSGKPSTHQTSCLIHTDVFVSAAHLVLIILPAQQTNGYRWAETLRLPLSWQLCSISNNRHRSQALSSLCCMLSRQPQVSRECHRRYFCSFLSEQHPLRDSRAQVAHLDFSSSTSNAMNSAVTKAFLHAKHVHPGIRNGKADLDVFARTVLVAVVITYRRGLIVRGQRCCFREKTHVEGIGNRQFDANRHLTIDHRHETVDLNKNKS